MKTGLKITFDLNGRTVERTLRAVWKPEAPEELTKMEVKDVLDVISTMISNAITPDFISEVVRELASPSIDELKAEP